MQNPVATATGATGTRKVEQITMLIRLQLQMVVAGVVGVVLAFTNPTLLNDKLILKVDSASHDRAVISDYLQEAYIKKYAKHQAEHLQLANDFISFLSIQEVNSEQRELNERNCIGNTRITYYLKSLHLIEKEYEASECRINLSNRYKSIVSPTEGIHETIHSKSNDKISQQLEYNLVEKLQSLPQLKKIDLYNFRELDYQLECLLEYQQLGQIKLKEKLIDATLEKIIEIPKDCGFNRFDDGFDGQFSELVNIFIPSNGTFVCKLGRSATCKSDIAHSSNTRYKLLDND